MKRPLILFGFALLVVAQLAVPTAMIDKRQTTLEEGVAYKFSIGPVDPYDPFLGRYLILNLEAALFEQWQGGFLKKGQKIYAVLAKDEQGFATISSLSKDRPGQSDYLRAHVTWQSGPQVRLQLPFSRYYLEEHAAQSAWRVRRNGRREPVPAHIVVKIRNGFGVLEELYFNDQPLLEYMEARGLWSPTGAQHDAEPRPTTAPLTPKAAPEAVPHSDLNNE